MAPASPQPVCAAEGRLAASEPLRASEEFPARPPAAWLCCLPSVADRTRAGLQAGQHFGAPTKNMMRKRARMREARLPSEDLVTGDSRDGRVIASTVGLVAPRCLGNSDC